MPVQTAPDAEWTTFLTSRTYVPTLIWYGELATVLWGKRTGRQHADFLRLFDSLKLRDKFFAYLAKHLRDVQPAKEAA